MEWIGPDRRFDDKVDQFFHRLENFGGAMVCGYRDPGRAVCPQEAVTFVASQYERFGIKIPPEAELLYKYGIACLIDICDYLDPYLIHWKYSDVCVTDDWANHVFKLVEADNKVVRTCEYDDLETFVYQPNAAEEFFNWHIVRPGMGALPPEISSPIEEFHNEVISGDRYIFGYGTGLEDGYADVEVIKLLCFLHETEVDGRGLVNHEAIKALFDLSLWAATLWLLGPLGREFRRHFSDVTAAAMEFGECILYQSDVYTPLQYMKTESIPGSCENCGVGAWCVEPVHMSSRWVVNACEKCASEGRPSAGFGTCGTRICRYTACHHNPFHGEASGMYQAHRANGQLMARAQERSNFRLGEVHPQKKMIGED